MHMNTPYGTGHMKAGDTLPAIWFSALWAGAPMFWHYWLKSPFFLYGTTGLQDPRVGGPILLGCAVWAAILTSRERRTAAHAYAAGGFLLATGFGLALYVEHSGFLIFVLAGYTLLRATPLLGAVAPEARPLRVVILDKLSHFGQLAMVLIAGWAALLYFDIDPANLIHSGQDKLRLIEKDTDALMSGKAFSSAPRCVADAPAAVQNDSEAAELERELREERKAALAQRPVVLEHIRKELELRHETSAGEPRPGK